MKMMKLAQAVILATPLFLAACAGDDGKDGVNGTNGVDGQDGATGAVGANGQDGTAGANGQDGAAGANGQDGSQSLVKQVFVPAGDEQCFQGGVRIESGIDSNDDGMLSSDEVSDTNYVCAPTQLKENHNFVRVASFPVCSQIQEACNHDIETAAEIVDVSSDGTTLIYSDSPAEVIGFVDITNPGMPVGLGFLPTNGEPTSVAVAGDHVLVGVNTSADFVNTSGSLAVVDVATMQIVHSIDLGGQPDSVAVSPDKRFAAIAIENERDEDLDDGQIDIAPQAPAGYLVIVDMADADPQNWTSRTVIMSGLADIAPNDPEPEYVDINEDNVAVVTMQENNHIVLVDLVTGSVIEHFNAGNVDLELVDTAEEDVIDMSSSLTDVPREADGVTWINNEYFVTADEGDMNGGSRGFTIYKTDGTIVYTSGAELDHLTARFGHYPEGRSENKGNEPENAEVGIYGDSRYLFVNSERSSLVFVFDVADPTRPVFKQALPAAAGPEGVKAIPSRNLLVAASEEDNRGDKLRSVVNIYSYNVQPSAYPTIESVNRENGSPIPFAALSGLSADYSSNNILWSVEDSAFDKSRIFKIDTSMTPAKLVKEIRIVDTNDVMANMPVAGQTANDNSFDAVDLAALINDDKTVNIDPEGIASVSDGFWVVSEGSGTVGDAKRPIKSLNMLIKTDMDGVIEKVVTLPNELNDVQLRFGFEGVTVWNDIAYVAMQRAWDNEANPRIAMYDINSDSWSFSYYPLEAPTSQNGGWVGLSDITYAEGQLMVLERDNQGGPDAAIKRIYTVDLTELTGGLNTVNKTLLRDVKADLDGTKALTFEKVEGLSRNAAGEVYILNDNDGVDDNSGENQLINLGVLELNHQPI